MGLDLGTLSITIKVDDGGAAQTLDNLERRAKNLKQSVDHLDKGKVNIGADTKQLIVDEILMTVYRASYKHMTQGE